MSYMYNPGGMNVQSPQYGYGWSMPGTQSGTPSTSQPVQTTPSMGQGGTMLPIEQSYIENILRLNRGKTADVHMTFDHEGGSQSKIFRGVIEAAGRDHIILSEPSTGKRYLLLTVYLDYITFDEPIAYSYPFGGTAPLTTYSPR
ncbi:spore coat protein GerQ [Aneurinibacillus sp. REN35]|uniref:spore coat protein GerQ n=1 Tax=Aneurinibacillus sp. REN35 TaxID=3237286 RepID=UPI003526E154